MDSTRFDKLTRELLAVNSRRGAVRTLAAASLGLGLTRLGATGAGAGKNKNNNKNKKKKNKKPQNTKDLGESCSHTSQCKGELRCDIAYSQQSCPGQETGKFCCVQTDVQAKCNDSCDCCGLDVICNGGYCQSA
jgi:hypothetical protein